MQLDYLSLGQPAHAEQFDFWTPDLTKTVKPRAHPDYRKAESFFHTIQSGQIAAYKAYWQSVAPENDSERFKRFLFAYMSVHTTWEANVTGYQNIKHWPQWIYVADALKAKLQESKVGLHNSRTRYIDSFSRLYWSDESLFIKTEAETWVQFRNRLTKIILGLGITKVSFALEMIYPNECEVTCMDVHLFRLYGLNPDRDMSLYQTIEAHWISMCKMWHVPSYIARCLFWDKNQAKADSRYWSYVLE